LDGTPKDPCNAKPRLSAARVKAELFGDGREIRKITEFHHESMLIIGSRRSLDAGQEFLSFFLFEKGLVKVFKILGKS
jgi:hypothetical protein